MTDLPKTDSTQAGPDVREAGPRQPRSVVTECDLPDAPEKVWKALIVPELLARWLPDALESEILAAEPHRLLRYRWPAGERDKDGEGRPLESTVTFELSGTSAGGTHLRVVHRLSVSAVAPRATAVCDSATVVPFTTPRRRDPVALASAPDLIVSSHASIRIAPLAPYRATSVTIECAQTGLRWAA